MQVITELKAMPSVALSCWDEVNRPTARQWCDVLGLNNARHVDGDEAPVAMLHVWTMPGYSGRFPDGAAPDLLREASERLSKLGYIGVMGVRIVQEYLRPLRYGERLTRNLSIGDVSAPKRTSVGEGVFVTEVGEVFSAGELVGRTRLTLLCFRPAGREARSGERAAVADPTDSPFAVPLTARFIAAAAVATRDFEDVHLDSRSAQVRGVADIYLNIMTTLGLIQRCIETTQGPQTDIVGMDVRLLAPAFPDDRLTFRVINAAPSLIDVELQLMAGVHARGLVQTR